MVGIYIISLFFLIILNIMLCFVKDRTKYSLFLFVVDVLSIIAMVAIMTHANYSDLLVYERHYAFSKYDMLNSRFEDGFNWYMVFCKYFLKLSYTQFKFATFSLCILLLYIAYRKITYNFSYFAMLFMMYEIFFNGVQIRNFMAVSLVAFGIPYLLNGEKKGIAIYVMLVVVAFSIHHSSLAYLALALIALPLRKILDSKIGRTIILLSVGVILYTLIYLTKKGILKQLIISFSYQYVSEDVGNRVVSHSGGRWGGSQMFLFCLIILYFVAVLIINNYNYVSNIENYKYKLSFRNLLIGKETFEVNNGIGSSFLFLNLIAIFYIVLCIFSSTFYRLLRGMCLIDIIYFSAIINNTSKKEWRGLILGTTVVFNLFWVYYDLIVPQRLLEHIMGFLG